MSGSNDALTQFMMLQARNQQRRPSAQARLAEQMMASLNNPAPIYGAGSAIARVGSGVLAGLMSGMAERSDQEREDRQLQQVQDRQDKRRYLDGQELANIPGMGGAPAQQPAPAAPAPEMPPAPAQRTEGGDLPRGIRNNNPLNIVDAPFTRGQPGFQGSDGRFGKFDTMDSGIAAADRLLASYGQRGLNTPQAIIARWAPAGDGSNNPTAYAATIARQLGIAPDAPIDMNDPAMRRRLIDAMAVVENGRPIPTGGAPVPQVPQAAPNNGITLETINQVARLAASGNAAAAQALPQLRWQFEQSQRRQAPPPTITTAAGVFVQNPDGTLGRRLGDRPEAAPPALLPDNVLKQQMQLRQSGAGSTNVNMPAERALLQADVDTIKTMNEAANQMFTTRELFARARQAIQNAPEGQGAQLAPFIGQLGRTLGIDIPGTNEAEVLQSITARLAPAQRIAGSGASSDRDVNLFLQAVPRLGRTREGNLQILDMGERVAERTIEIARLYRRHAGDPNLIDIINKLPPIFSDDERRALTEPGAARPSAGAPQTGGVAGPGGMTLQPPPAPTAELPIVTSPADAMRLPPGTRFRTSPNGPIREVPRQ